MGAIVVCVWLRDKLGKESCVWTTVSCNSSGAFHREIWLRQGRILGGA